MADLDIRRGVSHLPQRFKTVSDVIEDYLDQCPGLRVPGDVRRVDDAQKFQVGKPMIHVDHRKRWKRLDCRRLRS